MAKTRLVQGSTLEFALSVFVALALVGCGSQTGAGSGANGQVTEVQATPFCVAPVDGSPEEAAFVLGHCSRQSSFVAPIEGSPEQTAAEPGR